LKIKTSINYNKKIKNKNTETNTKIFQNSDNTQTSDENIISNNFAKQFNYESNKTQTYNYIKNIINDNKLTDPIISMTVVLREINDFNF
jgi:hypothetical protein